MQNAGAGESSDADELERINRAAKRIIDIPDSIPSNGVIPVESVLANTLRLTSLESWYNQPAPAHRWLVKDRLLVGSFSIITGKPKAGKSTLARTLLTGVVKGDPLWLDKFPLERQGPVIYLAVEEKPDEVIAHFKQLGITQELSKQMYLLFGTTPIDLLVHLRTAIEEINPVLVVLDPLMKVVVVSAQNSSDGGNTSTGRVLQKYMDLARESGAHFAFVHHLGKTERDNIGDAVLGPQSIVGSADTIMFLRRGKHGRVLSSLQRYGPDLDSTFITMNNDTGQLVVGVPPAASRDLADLADTEEKIMAALMVSQRVESANAMFSALGGFRARFMAAWNKLLGNGAIIRVHGRCYTFKGSDLDLNGEVTSP